MAVPNLRRQLDDLFGERPPLRRFTFTGSHKGPVLIGRSRELLLTGRSFRLQGVGIYAVAEGQIVDSRIWFDLAPFASA